MYDYNSCYKLTGKKRKEKEKKREENHMYINELHFISSSVVFSLLSTAIKILVIQP